MDEKGISSLGLVKIIHSEENESNDLTQELDILIVNFNLPAATLESAANKLKKIKL